MFPTSREIRQFGLIQELSGLEFYLNFPPLANIDACLGEDNTRTLLRCSSKQQQSKDDELTVLLEIYSEWNTSRYTVPNRLELPLIYLCSSDIIRILVRCIVACL